MDRRDDITVLPADDPNKERLGYKIHMIPMGMTSREYWKQELSEEEFAQWEYENDSKRNSETDKADKYRTNHKFDDKHSWSGGVIPVLQVLWGQPWNNLALNYIHALRPSALRVAINGITCDSQPWRVTVWLEKDGRTIKSIEQEVELATRGALDGHDHFWNLQAHHIEFVCNGGTNDIENLEFQCRNCHGDIHHLRGKDDKE